MTYIKRYFLPWFLLFLVVFVLPLPFNAESTSDDAYYVIPIMALILTFICSGLYYFWNTKWGAKQRLKIMEKVPFTDFYKLGFERKEDFAIGTIQNYQVIIRYNWTGSTGKPSISFETIFNPKREGRFMPQSVLDRLNTTYKKEKIDWFQNFVTKEWEFNFRPPSIEKIFPYIKRSVELLEMEKFEPMTLQQADEMVPEFERYLEYESNRKRD